jgi:hypothetical protein
VVGVGVGAIEVGGGAIVVGGAVGVCMQVQVGEGEGVVVSDTVAVGFVVGW